VSRWRRWPLRRTRGRHRAIVNRAWAAHVRRWAAVPRRLDSWD
jgi:hypothetical protein